MSTIGYALIVFITTYGYCTVFHPRKKQAAALIWNLFFICISVLTPLDCLCALSLLGAVLGCAWIEDWKSRCFSSWWLLAVPLLFAGLRWNPDAAWASRLGGMSYGLLSVWFVCKKKMGSADLICLLVMGFVLGFERMSIALGIACLAGLMCLAAFRLDDVPFVSFLCLGYLISLVRGYTIFSHLMLLLAP